MLQVCDNQVLKFPFHFPDLSPYYVLFVITWVKEILWEHEFECVSAVRKTARSSSCHSITVAEWN